MPRLTVAVLLVPLLLSACLGEDPAGDGQRSPREFAAPPAPVDPRVPSTAEDPRVVVAVIDTGINVYHDWFRRNASLPPDLLAQFTNSLDTLPPERLTPTQIGNYTNRRDADKAMWEALKPRTLYYFEGTNILGISFGQVTATNKPVRDDSGHGSGTSGAVLLQNPNAIIVMVEQFGTAAEQWAAQQPWIDIISMSYGPPGSIPVVGSTTSGLTTHRQTKLMWGRGQVPVGAADNSPALSPNDETSGPPWVVGVAGDSSQTRCRQHGSGTFPDFVSDFTQVLPRHNDVNLTRSMSGTSFATPKTAGVFSAALYDVRKAWNHTGGIRDKALAIAPDGKTLTNGGLREAFNRTAVYFGTSDCVPPSVAPVNPVAPWVQMGWGHVGKEQVPATVDHALGVKAAPNKPMGAVQFQQTWQTYRENLWSRI